MRKKRINDAANEIDVDNVFQFSNQIYSRYKIFVVTNNHTYFGIVNNIINFMFTLIFKFFFVIVAEWKIQLFIEIYVRTNNGFQNKIMLNESTDLHEIHIHMNADCIKNINIKFVKSINIFFDFQHEFFLHENVNKNLIYQITVKYDPTMIRKQNYIFFVW